MSLQSIGAVLLVLAVVFVVSQVWFHCVEGVLGLFKRLFGRKREPSAWHPLMKNDDETR